MFIESSGLVVLRVHCKGANPGDVCRLKRSKHRVSQETATHSLTLPGDRDRKTRKQHDRHGMTGQTLRQALGSVVIFNLADHKRVVTDELLIRYSDIGLRCFCLLILKCVSDQEKIESIAATIKRVDSVIALQLFDTERTQLDAAAVEDTRFLEKPSQAWGRAGWRGESVLEGLPLAGR